ncbi:MAG TPA: RimK family alpha-L-glutamate ligase [Verrucomicrobia bacterium]|nr:MAG: alpha-L-glutamate ligase [Lentisphaerae bacterium GWF2_57_35]HBA84385.1 RimK family alpha-L-glutamate ligase [Verrucomicrobiota bacterium]
MDNKPTMHGWILYTGNEVKELTRACEEARTAGVQLEVVAPKEIELVLDGREPKVFRNGVATPLPMFALAAFVEEADFYNLALLQQLETQGVLCVNRADTLKKTGDKLLTLQLLAAQGLPVPKTILVRKDSSPQFICEQLGLPVVIKIVDGSKGHGVTLVQTEKELENLLEMLEAARSPTGILAQEFIADSRGHDLRVLVIDAQPRVGMLRKNRSPEGFKSNVSAGGSAEAYPLTDAIRALSSRVIEILGLNIGGIDLLFKGDGFVVGEANSIPGFQGIESCNVINVPVEILKSIGRQLKERAMAKVKALAEGIRSLDDLRGKKEPELVQTFMGACSSVEKVQHAILMDIVHRNAQTEFGKAHGFEGIRSVEEFRRQVPIGVWEKFEPYTQRMEQGEKDLLFAGQPMHFVCTSGTTGHMKLLPESAEGEFAKALVSRMRTALLVKMIPELMNGYFIPLSNAAVMGQAACGIPFGTASGLTLAGTPEEIRRRMAFPPDILRAKDAETLDYLIMRYAVAQPLVRLVVGNNPGRLTSLAETANNLRDRLIADIEQGTLPKDLALDPEVRQLLEANLKPDPERAQALRQMVATRGRLEPRDYWPGLKMISCWLGGTIGRYLEGLKPWLPEGVAFTDCGYGASEGKFNIPMKAGLSEGPLAILGYFFEFEPMSGGEPLMAHELKDGEDYGLLLTSYSGLYRYDLHDIVRVKGFTGQNPNIHFISKTRDIANLAGEKLTGAFLAERIRDTLAARNLRWRHFCVVADSARHGYDYCIEPEGEAFPDAAWLADLEKTLLDQAPIYRILSGQRLIQSPRLIVMKPGWLDRIHADHVRPGISISQLKLPLICDKMPHPELLGQVFEI